MHARWLLLAALAALPPIAATAEAAERMATSKPAASELHLTRSSAAEETAPPPPAEQLPGPAATPAAVSSYTLTDLEALALGNNPTLLVAGARVQAANGEALQACLCPNPRVGYLGDEMGNEGHAGMHGAFIEQEFVRGDKLRLAHTAASQNVRRAQALFAAQQQRILTDVRVGFFEVLAAQHELSVTGELVRVGDEGVKTVEALLEGKEVAPADRLQARIEANSARILLRNAENRLYYNWRSLTTVLGLPDLPPMRVDGQLEADLPDITWDGALASLLGQSPELAAAYAEVDRARWALRRAQAEPIPNVTVRAGVQHDSNTRDTFANVEVGLPLPVYDDNRGNIAKAQGELRAAQGQVRRVELSLGRRLAVAFERYANARQQVETYDRDILPDAQQALNLTTLGYQQGEFGYVTVLTAQRTYFQTSLARLQALLELRRSAAAIEGLLLENSLDQE